MNVYIQYIHMYECTYVHTVRTEENKQKEQLETLLSCYEKQHFYYDVRNNLKQTSGFKIRLHQNNRSLERYI